MFNVNVQSKNKFREDLFRMRRVTVNFDVKSLKMFKVLGPTHTDAVRRASKRLPPLFSTCLQMLAAATRHFTPLFFFQHSQRRFLFFLREHIAAVCRPLGMLNLKLGVNETGCARILKNFSRITLGSCCIGNLVVCQVVWL